jgi:alpha-L-fucosidase
MDDIRPTAGDASWFVHDRFGMFIHWGLYALPARHEWIRHNEQISNEDYQKYFDHFDPDLYDPDLWAEKAAEAGMKYFVITTKHHEGFCLWDSQLTDYKAPNTPAGRDLLRPMVDAFRGRGLRTGLYHSLIDWHHPDFTVDDLHALRNHPDRAKLNEGRDQQKYIQYLHGQVRELLTGYGPVDIMWFDFSYPSGRRGFPEGYVGKGRDEWGSADLVKLVRELAPHILLDDRLDLPDVPESWDIRTPEQTMSREWPTFHGQRVVWEACHTFSGSWGYHRDEETWKSVEMLLQMLVDTVSKGGNLLLNVGPTGRGEFDYRALERLEGMGRWMRVHNRSIYGCTQAPAEFVAPSDCRYTYNPQTRRLYLHVFAWPFGAIYLENLADKVAYAQLLNDASEVRMSLAKPSEEAGSPSVPENLLQLQIPVKQPNATVPVIELFLK